MRKNHIILLPILLLILTACHKPEPKWAKITVGDKVPAFECETISGDVFDSRDTKGKPTVLVFFNTFCDDCREELPDLQVFREACEEDVARLMLVGRDETKEAIEHYWKLNAFTMPACAGNGRREYELFADSGIPRMFVYDKDGIVRLTYGPDDRPNPFALLSFIESLRKR